jgi:small GTP-binding protein
MHSQTSPIVLADKFQMRVGQSYRVVVIGDCAVGKTSIISRIMNDSVDLREPSTSAAAYVEHKVTIDGATVDLHIWDTAGQERFRGLGPIYYRDADIGLLVFSVTNRDSFENIEDWIQTFTSTTGADVTIFVIGNKTDLKDQYQVDVEQVRLWARKREYQLLLTSALKGTGIIDLFNEIARVIIRKGVPPKASHDQAIDPGMPPSSCC